MDGETVEIEAAAGIEEAAARMETPDCRAVGRWKNRGGDPMDDGCRGREDGDGAAAR